MFWTRFRRISAANTGPNRFHQSRTVSWQMSMPRPNGRSSTFLSDSGYLPWPRPHRAGLTTQLSLR